MNPAATPPVQFCIIPGAMKCGTTSLYEALAEHSQIAPCELKKEPNFFLDPYRWARGLSYYLSLYTERGDPSLPRYFLDATTDYGKLPYFDCALDRMQQTIGDRIKIIYMMRDPFRRIESHHLHAAATKFELFKHPPEQSDFSLDAGVSEAALQISRYAYHLDRFCERFGSTNVLPVVLEELMKNQDEELRRVTDFLELKPLETRLPAANTRSHKYRNETLEALQSSAWIRNAVRKTTSPTLRNQLKEKLFPKRQLPGRFKLNDDERQQIANELREDLTRLRAFYQVDLSLWDVQSYL